VPAYPGVDRIAAPRPPFGVLPPSEKEQRAIAANVRVESQRGTQFACAGARVPGPSADGYCSGGGGRPAAAHVPPVLLGQFSDHEVDSSPTLGNDPDQGAFMAHPTAPSSNAAPGADLRNADLERYAGDAITRGDGDGTPPRSGRRPMTYWYQRFGAFLVAVASTVALLALLGAPRVALWVAGAGGVHRRLPTTVSTPVLRPCRDR
jgi:hypothetical protein